MRIVIAEAGAEYRVASDRYVRSPEDVARVCQDIAHSDTELFSVLSLNSKNGMKGADIVSAGISDACLVHPSSVFYPAIMRRAHAIVLAHNHPSGDPTPSAEDIRITRTMVEAGKVLGIRVLDHVILTVSLTRTVVGLSLREAGLVSFDL